MFDWHCHILPGIDDGAPSVDDSLQMAVHLSSAGYTHVFCTPHRLRGMYDTTRSAMLSGLEALQGRLQDEGISVTLLPGMEYCLDEFFVRDFSADPVPLGQTRRVLVETPSNADPQLLRENIFHLVRSGYVPLFAHPERHAFLAPPVLDKKSIFNQVALWGRGRDFGSGIDGTLLEELQLMGCEFQGNLGSVGGYYGSLVQQQEGRLRRAACYTCYGSDGHNAKSLNQFLESALQVIRSTDAKLLDNLSDLIAP